MNILMVSSETVPFSKSGGLADVVGALSSQLVKLGHTVKVFMPMYGSIDQKGFRQECSYKVDMLEGRQTVTLLSKVVSGVTYLGLCHDLFTSRKGIYGDTSFAPYPDNLLRFSLMCKAAVAYARKDRSDILHAHDWTAGLAVYLAKAEGLKCATVMTIHNLAYMGDFARYDALLAKFTPTLQMLSGEGMNLRFNMLKTGLAYADRITTVSPTYAREIQGAEQGYGLDWLLRQRSDVLSGVINGIDTNEWNPARDRFFSQHFSSKDISGKKALKAEVQRRFSLKVDADVPLIAMISRLAEQKGFGPLLEGDYSALERIVSDGRCQFLIIGTGDRRYEDKLKAIASRHDNISVNIVFSQALSHLVEGGADFFLMPSKYEPCGLNQMYSLRYGTLPIAHRTGGLADTIDDVSSEDDKGDGFLFDNVYSDEIVQAVDRAIAFYQDKPAMEKAIRNAMRKDFSWKRSAQQYESIYEKALGGNHS